MDERDPYLRPTPPEKNWGPTVLWVLGCFSIGASAVIIVASIIEFGTLLEFRQ